MSDAAALNPAPAKRTRLVEVDALRGIAAMLVVLFHFTTRYDQLYGHAQEPLFAVPWGFYGVNLFFIISGFVIFMTLERTRRPMDFIVSRFSRLYPVFWAAVLVTFLVTSTMGLPGKEVSLLDAGLNLLMFHSYFGVPDVDSVYWTLGVELLFYMWAFALFLSKQTARVHYALYALIGAKLVYFLCLKFYGIDLPWRLSWLFILQYIPWFACGIAIFRLSSQRFSAHDICIITAATVVLFVVDGTTLGLLCPCLCGATYLAATGRLSILNSRLLVWLGGISYPLYLVHENIGWSVIRRLQMAHVSTNASIAVTFVAVLVLATCLSYAVEKPGMRWIRNTYRERRERSTRLLSPYLASALAAVFASLIVVALLARPTSSSAHTLLGIQTAQHTQILDCARLRARNPIVILALGQSNAANNGATGQPSAAMPVIFEGKCYLASDPLPGGTGTGGSIWSHLPPVLPQQGLARPIVVAVVAIDGSTIRQWTETGPLQELLHTQIDSLTHAGFKPDFVLWQQGEADARAGTSTEDYLRRFKRLTASIHDDGIYAPILAALSTRCGDATGGTVRQAIAQAISEIPGVFQGPDTDTLRGDQRIADCHFSHAGLDSAAALWAAVLTRHLQSATSSANNYALTSSLVSQLIYQHISQPSERKLSVS